MLRCAALFVIAAYEKVRLTPQRLRALPLAILRSRHELHLKGKHYSVSFTIFKKDE
jgi:hypothetical protein